MLEGAPLSAAEARVRELEAGLMEIADHAGLYASDDAHWMASRARALLDKEQNG